MKRPDLSDEERMFLIEAALETLQNFGKGPYLGICVNSMLDDFDHPHWDQEHVDLARAVTKQRRQS